MKIRSVYIRNHNKLGELNINIRGEDGVVPRVFGIWGNNKSGKSLILKMIKACWMTSVTGRVDSDLKDVTGYITYEVQDEVFVVRITNGIVEVNSGLGKFCNIEKVKNCILYYGEDRVGLSGIYNNHGTEWLIRDAIRLSNKGSGENVALIDDFDIGLDKESREKMYVALIEYHTGINNQVIITGREAIEAVSRYQKLKDSKEEWIKGMIEDIKRGKV